MAHNEDPIYADVRAHQKNNGHRSDFNLEDRDPRTINPHLMVQFDDVFAEPNGIKSADCTWRCSYNIFRGTKWCCYTFLSALCFIPISFCWGCCFACVPFVHIWCHTPMSKCMKMNCHSVKVFVSIFIDTVFAPLFYACGLVFSRCRLSQFHENQPFRPIDSDIHRV